MFRVKILKGIPGWVIWLAKIFIAAVAIRFILLKVFRHESINELTESLKALGGESSRILLSIVCLLLILNLLIESFKWIVIMKPLEKISLIKSVSAVLTGISVSFFIPNRAGEFVGRVLYVEQADKIKTSLVTILASIGQLVITLSVGCLFMIVYLRNELSSSWIYFPLAAIILLLSAGLVFIFIFFPYFAERFSSLPFLRKFSEYLSVLKLYKPKIFLTALALSLLRYSVFIHQYYLLQKIFFPEAPYLLTIGLISIIYLALAVIPTFALSEIGVRSSVAVFYLGSIISSPVAITLATLAIWIINIVFPALIGSVLFLFIRFPNGKNNFAT
ncbi:MAG TPA: lysylphosphatidylglycerol synthase domain-containing protein [Bacteroidia bacterium]|nr:lysylphosphatidylglycerol synthase domain-containing protein [Bacteroidia bacterium]